MGTGGVSGVSQSSNPFATNMATTFHGNVDTGSFGTGGVGQGGMSHAGGGSFNLGLGFMDLQNLSFMSSLGHGLSHVATHAEPLAKAVGHAAPLAGSIWKAADPNSFGNVGQHVIGGIDTAGKVGQDFGGWGAVHNATKAMADGKADIPSLHTMTTALGNMQMPHPDAMGNFAAGAFDTLNQNKGLFGLPSDQEIGLGAPAAPAAPGADGKAAAGFPFIILL